MLPPTLAGIHDVFHGSMLQKCIADSSHGLDYKPLQIHNNLTYEEVPIQGAKAME